MSAPGDTDPRDSGLEPSNDLDRRDPRPTVALRGTGLPTPLLIALAAVLAVALFVFLNAQRRARIDALESNSHAATTLPPAPPPLEVPPPPPPPAPVVIHIAPPAPPPVAMPPPREPPPPPLPEMPPQTFAMPAPPRGPPTSISPALVVDLTAGSSVAVNGEGATGAAAGDDTVRATLIHNRASVIPQGAIITAVLETPLNSDRPGLARAIVSHDARGFDGTRVLIPRGSRLVGEFKADASPGLRRILITWTRLIRPDGIAIRIGSPVSDPLGGAGVPGSVNTHFLARFAGAVLQTALAIGVDLASQTSSSTNTVYLGLPSQATPQLGQLMPDANRPPTVKVKEGAEIAVMVAHDLDFSGTPAVR